MLILEDQKSELNDNGLKNVCFMLQSKSAIVIKDKASNNE